MYDEKPRPTWVNDKFVLGPLAHYEHITEAQALALGVPRAQLLRGGNRRQDNCTVTRLSDGTFNVRMLSAAPKPDRVRDSSFAPFLRSLTSDQPAGSEETIPGELREILSLPTAPRGRWSFDADGRVSVSAPTYELHGVTEAQTGTIERVDQALNWFVHPRDRMAVVEALASTMSTGDIFETSYRRNRVGGKMLYARGIVRPGKNGRRKIIGMVTSEPASDWLSWQKG